MRYPWIAGLLLLSGAMLMLAGQVRPADTPKPTAPVVRLAAQAERKPASVLAYRLLPDPLDEVEGNAAPVWIRAALAARIVRFKWTEKEWKWAGPGPEGTSLKDLPRKEVQAALDKHAAALRLAGQAALRKRCDWERPPLTIQNLNEELGLDEVQSMREMARLLSLRCRLELSERDFDAALRTLQIGFTLARHVSEARNMIHDLVAIAIASIMLGRIEEWVQIPGSPNLYWALTDMPHPFIDARRSIRFELATVYRSFPPLRELKKKKLTAEEAQALVEKVFEAMLTLSDERPPKALRKLAITTMALKFYPEAKKGLLASGRTQKEVEALPTLQAVAIYYLEQYDRARDEILAWVAVPAWQGLPHLEKAEAAYRTRSRTDGNVFIGSLMPAIVKVYDAQLRLERQLAGLRGAEALRQYAADHAGKAPAKWSDLSVPSPIDPFTGKDIESWYSRKDSQGVLDVPPPPGQSPIIGRRYLLGSEKKGKER